MDYNLELKKKRDLALKTLNKYSEMHQVVNNSPNPNSTNNHSLSLNRTETEYIKPGRYASFNISELAGRTMEISTPPSEKESLDFKPSEINARSTMNQASKKGTVPIKPRRRLQSTEKYFSAGVQDILATSTCKEIRNLRDSLQETSLPRTADMSFMSSVRDSMAKDCDSFWNLPVNSKNVSDASLLGRSNVVVADDEFMPAEKMAQRLLEDEKQWEQEYADIPTTQDDTAHDETRPIFKAPLQKAKLREKMNFGEFSGFMNDDTAFDSPTAGDHFSFGQFFNGKSDELGDMVSKSVPPTHQGVPLVDMSQLHDCTQDGDKASETSVFTVQQIDKILNQMNEKDSPKTMTNNLLEKLKPTTKADSKSPASELNIENVTFLLDKMKEMKLNSSKNTTNKFLAITQLADTLSGDESFGDSNRPQPINLQTFAIPQAQPFKSNTLRSIVVGSGDKQGTFCLTDLQNSRNESSRTSVHEIDDDFESNKENWRPSDEEPASENAVRFQAVASILGESKESKKRPHSPDPRKHLPAAVVSQKVTEPFAQAEESSCLFKETPKSTMPLKRKQPLKENKELSGVYLQVPSNLSPRPPKSAESKQSPTTPNKRQLLTPDAELTRNYLKSPTEPDQQKLSLPCYGLVRTPSTTLFSPVPITRTYSQCSTGSEFSHRDGMIPLKSTRDEISWGSVRLRRTIKKSIQVKNTSTKRLYLKAVITGPGFQICGAEQNEIVILQAHECRSITVLFCPTVIGAAVGQLKFIPGKETAAYFNVHGTECYIGLFGYGGHASIEFTGICRGPVGAPFLTLGNAKDMCKPLEKSFNVYNKGNIPAFVVVMIGMNKGINVDRFSKSLCVVPSKLVIAPGAMETIKIQFKPTHLEMRKLFANKTGVVVVTNLTLLFGDEPTRHRIKQRVKSVNSTPIDKIFTKFPQEKVEDNIELFKESLLANIDELYESFREQELILTIDRSPDETLASLTGCSDQSSLMFKTLCSAVESDNEVFKDALTVIQSEMQRRTPSPSKASLAIYPSLIEINPKNKHPFQMFLKNNKSNSQFFQVDTNHRNLLHFTPNQGTILPHQERQVQIEMRGEAPDEPIYVYVYLENDKYQKIVHVRKDTFTSNMQY